VNKCNNEKLFFIDLVSYFSVKLIFVDFSLNLSMPTLKLNIEENHKEIIFNFLKLLDSVEIIEEEKPKYYYNTEKLDYSFEDIQEIIEQFPENKLWTAQDLESEYIFPPDCPFKIEILNYKIYIMRPTITHQEILSTLTVFMGSHILTNKLGKIYVAPVGVEISEGTVLEPDILFVSVEKKHIVSDDKKIREAPDLVVEVISPANYRKLREEKKRQYADFGIQEYWEIYPKKQKIRIETLQEKVDENTDEVFWEYDLHSEAAKEGKVNSSVLKDFSLDISQVFQS